MASHYVYWLGQDGNVWINQDGNTRNIGKAIMRNGQWNGNPESELISMHDNGTRIDDPNPGNKQAANTSDDVYYYGGGGSSSSGGSSAQEEAIKANMRSIYDRQIGDINHQIDSLQGQLDSDLAGVKNEYNTYRNEQQSTYNANKNDYDKNTLQNRQNLRTNRNDITDRASTGLRSMLRVLGAMGAGGGSEARYEIPRMVTNQANAEFNNAGQTYAQNQQNLDTDWGNYKNQFENDRKKLEDWYNGQVKSKKQESEQKRLNLLTDLATAYGNRAQYGGDYSNNFSDIYNRIAESRNRVTDLGKFTPTKYTGMTAVYNAPELSSYDTSKTNLTTSVVDSNTSATSPLLVALQGLTKKKNTSPYSNRTET